MKKVLYVSTLCVLAIGMTSQVFAGCGTCDKTIVENASSIDDFSTLVAAVKAAGLVDTLSGEGPFTVFAPTNEAFANLPAGTLEDLLKPENKEKLVSILTYHVVPGKVMAEDVVRPGCGRSALVSRCPGFRPKVPPCHAAEPALFLLPRRDGRRVQRRC